MALIRAMNSAVAGLRSQQYRIDVIGDNLANSTTTGFKSGRVNFETLLNQTLSYGTAPQGFLGGIDPRQIGLGVQVGETTKNFSQGELETTGVSSDLAIDGTGFFIAVDGSGRTVYTRDGSFGINPQNMLHNPANGYIIQGVNADLNTFTIASGSALTDIRIPIGEVQIAVATSEAQYDGNLNGGGAQALQGSILESSVLRDGNGGPTATAATLLTNLFMTPETAGPDIDLALDTGDTITIRGKKGGRELPDRVFRIGTSAQSGDHGYGTTLSDLMTFMQRSLGINTGVNATLVGGIRDNDNDPNTPGITGVPTAVAGSPVTSVTVAGRDFVAEGVQVGDLIRFNSGNGAGQISTITARAGDTITFTALSGSLPQPVAGDSFSVHEPPRVSVGGFPSAAGRLRIAGNVGSANGFSNIEVVSSDGISLSTFYSRQEASGESVVTNATFYDTDGQAHLVEMTYVLETKGGVDPSTSSTGNVFRYFAEAVDNRAVSGTSVLGFNRVAGTGTVTFSTAGQFLSQNPDSSITIALPNQGAATPLTVTPNLSGLTGFADRMSQVFLTEQDGFPVGVLSDYSIGSNGLVTGIFSNGVTRDIAQIKLANFSNPNGLQAIGSNYFVAAANSGQAVVGTPGTLGIGSIRSGVLEASNVDFAREFTNLIISQRGFQANARVIRTTDDLLEELVNIV